MVNLVGHIPRNRPKSVGSFWKIFFENFVL